MDLMAALASVPGIGPALPYITALIAVCAALAPMLPPPAGPSAYGTFYSVVNFIGLNLGHARNASAPASSSFTPEQKG